MQNEGEKYARFSTQKNMHNVVEQICTMKKRNMHDLVEKYAQCSRTKMHNEGEKYARFIRKKCIMQQTNMDNVSWNFNI